MPFFRQMTRWLVLALCLAWGLTGIALAEDLIITNAPKSAGDKRFIYPKVLLQAALERTGDRYGPFRLQAYDAPLPRNRALRELVRGGVTVFEAPTRREWELQTLPVRIPIRKGLLGYKVFLIRDEDQKRFAAVQSLEALKRIPLGSGTQWSTTQAFRTLGFTIVDSQHYEGLFHMLTRARFDWFPRGVNEVFQEFDSRKETFPTMRIESALGLYLPLPSYFFVTPKRPDLAKRIKEGLEEMVADGSLDRLFLQYHGESLKRAGLERRRIFTLPNPSLTEETPLHRKGLWLRAQP